MTSYKLLTTTRYDPALERFAWNNEETGEPSPFFLLQYHFDRLLAAAAEHDWHDQRHDYNSFKSIVSAAIIEKHAVYRVRSTGLFRSPQFNGPDSSAFYCQSLVKWMLRRRPCSTASQLIPSAFPC